MLRALIAGLLVANLLFFAWSQGWLDSLTGARSTGDREPERLQRQVHPELVRILPPGNAAAAEPVSLGCFEAGPFAAADLAAAQDAAQAALPAANWTAVTVDQPAIWIVYIGRYADPEAQSRRQQELQRRQLAYEVLTEPATYAPGLSLGRFADRTAAAQALDRYSQQGLRGARVVELTPAGSSRMLRVEQADADLASRIAALKPDAIDGKGLVGCSKSTAS